MTIRVGRDYLFLDGDPYFARVALTTSGGKLRLDQQDEEDGDTAPTSKVTYIYSGWTPRRAQLVLKLTRPQRENQAGLPRDAVARLKVASRGMDPERHTVLGDDFEAIAWDSPAVIEHMTESKGTGDHDSWNVTLLLLELDPELVSLRTAPQPEPDPPPAVQTTTENRTLIEELEATDFGPQPDPDA